MSRRRRRRLGNDESPSEEMGLQITSMADIFTIILVFLLKSFSTSAATITPAQGMKLPNVAASQKSQMRESLKLEVVSDAVLIDQKRVVILKDFNFPPAPERNPAEALWPEAEQMRRKKDPVYLALMEERKKDKEAEKTSNLMVLADEGTPYSTLQTIMGSAADAGYVDLQLVVVGAE